MQNTPAFRKVQLTIVKFQTFGREDQVRIIAAIDQIRTNPAAGGVLKGEFSGLRRIRIGNYRVAYEVQDQKLVVLVGRIGHRREVYRRLLRAGWPHAPTAHRSGERNNVLHAAMFYGASLR